MSKGNNHISNVFNPFPGLRPFGTEESYLYFGREGQSDEVLAILEKNHFVTILGSSGTGKSSLMFSGVIPTLHGGFITKAGNEWEVITTRPGLSPIADLAKNFRLFIENNSPEYTESALDNLINKNLFEATLRRSSRGIIELYKSLKAFKGKNLLIYFDQFEEIFRFRRHNGTKYINESLAYVNLILEAVNQSEVPIYIALSMRSDFLGDCEQFPDLTNKINESHYLIPQMTRDQKKLVIQGPVAVGNGTISNRLVQRLLNDMGDQPDQLPVLQHALMRSWDYWSKNKHDEEPIDFIHYEAIGGVTEALSRHADEAYYELTENEKLICEKLFKTITEKRSDNDGIRRPTKLEDIAQIVDEEEIALKRIIDKFRQKGRALLTPRADIVLSGESVIDISHEALMRVWYRLRNWVQEESESSQIYLRLSEAAQNYQQGNGALWRQPDLQLAIDWRNKTKPTLKWALQYDKNFEAVISFLNRSEQAYIKEEETKELLQKKRLKRSRTIASVLGVAAMVSIILVFFAFSQKLVADRQTNIAQQNAEEAQNNEDKAQESSKIALLRLQEANNSTLRANLQKQKAELNALKAKTAQSDAEQARNEAVRNLRDANASKKEAEEANEEVKKTNKDLIVQKSISDQLRMQSIATKLAVKSIQNEDDQLSAILAYLAYRFNRDNGGYENDNDIYNGLFYAVKGFEPGYYHAFRGNTGAVNAIALKNDKHLYTTGEDGRIIYRKLKDTEVLQEKTLFESSEILLNKIYVSENNDRLVALTSTNKLILIPLNEDAANPAKIVTLPASYAYDVHFKPNSSQFLVSTSDSTIYQYNDISFSPFIKTNARVYDMESLADKWIVTGSTLGNIQLWDAFTGRFYKNIATNATGYIHSLTTTDSAIAAGDNNGQITLYPLDKNFNLKESIKLAGKYIMSDLTFNTESNQIISASSDGNIRIWDLSDPDEFPMIINEPESWVLSVALWNNNRIFVGSKDQLFRTYPIRSNILADILRPMIKRDITQEEWDRYIGKEIEYKPIFEESVFVINN